MGTLITNADQIKAYDPRGGLCGQTTGLPGYPGSYNITVYGVYPESPYYPDGGCYEGEAVTFRINGVVANVVGSNIWSDKGSIMCDLEVPEEPPEADPGGPYSGSEGSPVTFDGSGSTGAVSYEWNFGDGTPAGSGIYPEHTYADDGTYTVTLTVTNGSAQTDIKQTTANISNVAPYNVTIGSDKTELDEGGTVNFSGSASDPGDDELTYSWSCNDGWNASGENASHMFRNNDTYTVTLTVFDGTDNGTDQQTITVNNVPPENVVAQRNPSVIDEGSWVSFNGSATDQGPDDVLTYHWNFNDGDSKYGEEVDHKYTDNKIYNVTLTVSDGDDNSTDQVSVTVNNVPPTAEAGGPYYTVVGQYFPLNGSATDPGSDDTHTFKWDMDNDGQYDDCTGKSAEYKFSSAGTYPISLKVTDDDGGSDTDGATVHVAVGVDVTITTTPVTGIKIIVDGDTYRSPKTFLWVPGVTYSIEAPWYHNVVEGSRYRFYKWSDEGSRKHNIVVPDHATEYRANYRRQHEVTIDDGGVGANTKGGGWYNEGLTVEISIDTMVVVSEETQYFFKGWTGSYTGSENPAQITVDSPMNIGVEWEKRHFLKVNTDYGTTLGEGWYEEGSDATFSITSQTVPGDTGIQYVFTGWTGTGSDSYSGTDSCHTVTMNNPMTENAGWKKQYYLATWVDPDSGGSIVPPPPGEWCDSSAVVDVSTETAGSYLWVGWSGDLSGTANPTTITMDGPKSVTANFGEVVQITVTTEPPGLEYIVEGKTYNTSQTFNWVGKSRHTLSVEKSPQGGDATTRYVFSSWSDGGEEQTHTYVAPDSDQTVTAIFKAEYYVTLQVDPEYGGTVYPFTAPGDWAMDGDTLELTAVGDANNGYGFFHWSGYTESNTNPLSIVLSGPISLTALFNKGDVTVTSDPDTLVVLLNGVEFLTPVVLNWIPGEKHQIGTYSMQGDSTSAVYQFKNWSDQGALEHEITVPDTPVTYLAVFSASYYLTVKSDYGNPVGEGLWEEGSEVTVTIDSLVEEDIQVRHKFFRWVGTGNGSVTSFDRNISVIMNGSITEKAEWQPQYKLRASIFPPFAPNGRIETTPPGPWYDPGTEVQLMALVDDTSYSFTEWSGDITGTDNPISVTIHAPMEAVAEFYAPNLPPQLKNIPKIIMMEDSVFRKSFDWLKQYVEDPNDPFLEWVKFSFEDGAYIQVFMDTVKQELKIKPAPEWNGVDTIKLTVTDLFGLLDTTFIYVTVISINDPPGKFRLIAPPQDTTISDWNGYSSLEFVWERSINVDPNDTISYTFFFGFSPDLNVKGYNISDTSIVYFNPFLNGTYYWAVRAEDMHGLSTWCDGNSRRIGIQTGIESDGKGLPEDYALSHNFPNPFNAETLIQYQLPKPGKVSLRVFDVRGTVVRTLVDKEIGAGCYTISWDGRDDKANPAASGVYFVQLEAGSFTQQRKMILLR